MYLFLDNSTENKIIFFVFDSSKRVYKFSCFGKKAQKGPLSFFEELIKNKKIILTKIKGIGVKIGAGRFTATRVAVTFGNTLGYFLKKPIIGLENFEVEDFLKKIKQTKKGIYLSAKYSGEANIGKAKKCL